MIPQIQFAANVIAGLLAAYTDWKTGYIYDWITYPLIVIGIVLSLLTGQWWGIVFGAVIYGLGMLAYKTGKIGGGDIKFLAGIALVQPIYEGMIFPFAVLLVGTLLACLVLSVYYVGKLLLARTKIKWKTKRKMISLVLVGAVGAFWAYANTTTLWPGETTVLLSISLLAGIIFYTLEDEIKAHAFLTRISLEQLEDDEVLAVEHLTSEEKQKWGKNPPNLIGTDDVLQLTQMKVNTILVYRNHPKFAPFLLMGIVATYLFPEWIIPLVPAVF
jgi:Flp pilus assembly protein protease CpaA